MNRGDAREGTSRKPQTLAGTMYQKENKARRVQETVFHFGTCLLYRARVVQEGENMTEPAKSSHLRGKRQRNKTNQKSGTRKVHCQQEPGQRQPAPQAPAQGPGSPQRCSYLREGSWAHCPSVSGGSQSTKFSDHLFGSCGYFQLILNGEIHSLLINK